MNIETIFEDNLYSFRYENTQENEYSRIFEHWDDPAYVRSFVKENLSDLPLGSDINQVAESIMDEAFELEELLRDACRGSSPDLNQIFQPLNNQEYKARNLSQQKGKRKYLRIYAIRIDSNCFVITGAAIKFTHLMKDRPHTELELKKINKCRDYLNHEEIFDEGSFYELINE